MLCFLFGIKTENRFVYQKFFLLSSPINDLTTPQISQVTLWGGPTPWLGTTGLVKSTQYAE